MYCETFSNLLLLMRNTLENITQAAVPNAQEVPEQPTKLLPLAPVWVMAPAYAQSVLKMTRSAPGEPTQKEDVRSLEA